MLQKSRPFARQVKAAPKWWEKIRKLIRRKKEPKDIWEQDTQYSTEDVRKKKKKKEEETSVPDIVVPEDIDDLLTTEILDTEEKPVGKPRTPGDDIVEPWFLEENTFRRGLEIQPGDDAPFEKPLPRRPREEATPEVSAPTEAPTGAPTGAPPSAGPPSTEEEKKKKEEEEKEKRKKIQERAAEIDISALGGRSDRQVLADARVLAVEMNQQLIEDVNSLLTTNSALSQLFQARGESGLQSLLEAAKPGAVTGGSEPQSQVANVKSFVRIVIAQQTEEIVSTYRQIVDKILDVAGTWTTLVNEKKVQSKVYADVLKKLRLPQFRLPVWLEWYATGVAPDVIKKKREERYNETVRDFLDSRRPLSKQQKKMLSDLVRSDVEKLQVQDNIVRNVFKQYPEARFVNEFFKGKSVLRDQLSTIRDRLLYDPDKGFYEDRPPAQVVQQVKEDMIKTIRNYEQKTGRPLEVTDDIMDVWMRTELANKDELVEVLKKKLGKSESPTQGSRSKREIFGQTLKERMKGDIEKVSPEGLPSGEEPSLQDFEEAPLEEVEQSPELTEKQRQALRDALEKVISVLEEFRKEGMMEVYARILARYEDPNFAPSLRALGAKWVKEHGEGSGTSYGLIETTREGDGEKLLTLFDDPTGLATKSVKLLGDYVKSLGMPQLDEAIHDLEDLADIRTPSSDERRKRIEEGYGKDTDDDSIPDEEDPDDDNDKIPDEKDPDDDNDKIPDKEDPDSKESEQPTKEIDDFKSTTLNITKDASSLADKMEEALSKFVAEPTPQSRYQIVDPFYQSLREIREKYQPLFESLPEKKPSKEATVLRSFVRSAAANLIELFGRPGRYQEYTQTLRRVLKQIEEGTDRELIVSALQELKKLLDPQAIRTALKLPGGVNVLDEQSYQDWKDRIATVYREERGIDITGEEVATEVEEGEEPSKEETAEQLEQRLVGAAWTSFIEGINEAVKRENPAADYDEQSFADLNEELLQGVGQQYKQQIEERIREGIAPDALDDVIAQITEKAKEDGQAYVDQKLKLVREKLEDEEVSEENYQKNLDLLVENLNKPVDEVVKIFMEKAEQTYDPENEEEVEEALGQNVSGDTEGEAKNVSDMPHGKISSIDVNRTNRLIALHKIQRAINS